MTEPFLYFFQPATVIDKQARAAMTKFVKTNVRQVVVFENLSESVTDIIGSNRVAIRPAKNIVAFKVAFTKQTLVFPLLLFQLKKEISHFWQQWKAAITAFRFGLKLKEWLLDVFKAKESLHAEPPQPKSPDLSALLFRYLDIQKAKGRKYSQSWQQQHTADELKAISRAVNLLSEKGIYTLEELDAALSAVHDKASEIRSGMKPRETRIRQLQKLIEQAQNLRETQPIHDEYKQIRWKGKQEKFAEAHRADLAVWDAANRYLRANLPDMKLTPKAWQTELAAQTAENKAEYAKLKAQREEVAELQKVRRYVDVALKADAPQKTKTKHHDIDR